TRTIGYAIYRLSTHRSPPYTNMRATRRWATHLFGSNVGVNVLVEEPVRVVLAIPLQRLDRFQNGERLLDHRPRYDHVDAPQDTDADRQCRADSLLAKLGGDALILQPGDGEPRLHPVEDGQHRYPWRGFVVPSSEFPGLFRRVLTRPAAASTKQSPHHSLQHSSSPNTQTVHNRLHT